MRHRSLGFFLRGMATVLVASLPVLSLAGAAASRPMGLRPLLLALTGDHHPAAKKAADAQLEASSELPPTGPRETIKVHGNWIIEVRNPDGSLVSHHEFKNVLIGTAALKLSELLSRQASVLGWSVDVRGNPVEPCQDSLSNPQACIAYENIWLFNPTQSYEFKNIVVTVDSIGALKLVGSVKAANSTQISVVRTGLITCSPAITPAPSIGCGQSNTDTRIFTLRVLANPIPVVAGQTIDFTVFISFS